MTKTGKLKLPKAMLLIDYNQSADKYFQFEETAPRDALSRLAFLGAIARLEFEGATQTLPVNADNLQKAGIGRKSLSNVVDSVLLCEAERFKILDGATTIMESNHFMFDDWDVVFNDSDSNIYENTIWSQNLEEKGRIQAYVDDIKAYCKINGNAVEESHISLKQSDGGIGWFLGAILLRVSVNQGKFELSVPTLSS